MVHVTMAGGGEIAIPVVVGILKHPSAGELRELLREPVVARKYTMEALRKAPWSVLRRFPKAWLVECLPHARLRPSRARALWFLLDDEPRSPPAAA
jgi:hypothetical protein